MRHPGTTLGLTLRTLTFQHFNPAVAWHASAFSHLPSSAICIILSINIAAILLRVEILDHWQHLLQPLHAKVSGNTSARSLSSRSSISIIVNTRPPPDHTFAGTAASPLPTFARCAQPRRRVARQCLQSPSNQCHLRHFQYQHRGHTSQSKDRSPLIASAPTSPCEGLWQHQCQKSESSEFHQHRSEHSCLPRPPPDHTSAGTTASPLPTFALSPLYSAKVERFVLQYLGYGYISILDWPQPQPPHALTGEQAQAVWTALGTPDWRPAPRMSINTLKSKSLAVARPWTSTCWWTPSCIRTQGNAPSPGQDSMFPGSCSEHVVSKVKRTWFQGEKHWKYHESWVTSCRNISTDMMFNSFYFVQVAGVFFLLAEVESKTTSLAWNDLPYLAWSFIPTDRCPTMAKRLTVVGLKQEMQKFATPRVEFLHFLL